ncbi:COX15/CtaA family protein [Rhodoferax aquaticus]|uniref:Heme A synthase n=1 Tax=Rhodoferax aquaticus TaxID=2527691 RepID=A0A515ESM8_9BURK|nr:COX15/CtaA family protein [Rhodoferax aquaticus]QDL55669.1 heme A synthase [Rhodoferax aquaticus]
METSLYDLSPVFHILLVGAICAALPLAWVAWAHRNASWQGKLRALGLVTLFLTFDLVLFGAFTRLTDSGLGCPDWPGCYGSASPLGAHQEISAAQSAMPTGPVTHSKAWIEMVHRYLATSVGGLILLLAIFSWRALWRGEVPRRAWTSYLPTLSLVWVCVQGAFGALTVTMKLFPAIVSLHLLGAYLLLALLTMQSYLGEEPPNGVSPLPNTQPLSVSSLWVVLALAMLVLQAASGAWVSTNYAVLACTEFPKCQGSWWPDMQFEHAFTWWRPLGLGAHGEAITFQGLTAIHYMHRLLAMATIIALGSLAWHASRADRLRSLGRALAALLVLQFATGLSNVVLDWPLGAAVLHTAGAGAMVVVLVRMLCSIAPQDIHPSAHAAALHPSRSSA